MGVGENVQNSDITIQRTQGSKSKRGETLPIGSMCRRESCLDVHTSGSSVASVYF